MPLNPGFPGTEIATKTEYDILLDWIEANWTLADPNNERVDFGAHPTRTTKDFTLDCWRRASNIISKNVGSGAFRFESIIAVDVYVRDVGAAGKKKTSTKMTTIETFLRGLILTNQTTLRTKGINHMMLMMMENPQEPVSLNAGGRSSGRVWYHMVASVRMTWNMFSMPI